MWQYDIDYHKCSTYIRLVSVRFPTHICSDHLLTWLSLQVLFYAFLWQGLTKLTIRWLCFGKRWLKVPEAWLFRFAGRTSRASPTLPEDGPPPPWIHPLLGFWILCEDLDHSRHRQAQPTHWEWEDNSFWNPMHFEYFLSLLSYMYAWNMLYAVEAVQSNS